MNVLNGGRIGASQALGIARAYEIALKYSKKEKHLEKIFNHQLTFKLADMYVKVTAANY
jgi:alkylation response protein AidB-like acyl-CoA dehydrogenase